MMEKRLLKKRSIIGEETVIAMNEGHCKKNCDNDATCGCGSMPGEYGRSFDASSHWHYNGEYNRYIHLP
ncbi:MAG: hypothetical protein HFI92_08115 [Lachnospiraceae bacterium]|nr:hypothetical protein [Lachnospiraceae bacterium]